MVSSIGAQIDSKHLDTGFHVTTPSPFQVQKLIKRALDAKSQYLIVEATSHGLEQNRLAFINFKIAVATNITSDHMDYHKTLQNYANAKLKLFKHAKISILNMDDESYQVLKDKISGKIITYSLDKHADFNLKSHPLRPIFTQAYNRSNALAAAAAASMVGIPKTKILEALKSFKGISGRMQQISIGQNFRAIVDFAHTPNALKNVLGELKKEKSEKSRLIAVFGSAGERDKTKREVMGEIAANLADVSVITSEDPRSEKASAIVLEISRGFKKTGKKENIDYFKIADRKKAIRLAINLAKKGDIVVFLGKGHEKSMTIGNTDYPWDEVKEVEKAIGKRKG